jgi:hypothetical protein
VLAEALPQVQAEVPPQVQAEVPPPALVREKVPLATGPVPAERPLAPGPVRAPVLEAAAVPVQALVERPALRPWSVRPYART